MKKFFVYETEEKYIQNFNSLLCILLNAFCTFGGYFNSFINLGSLHIANPGISCQVDLSENKLLCGSF